MIRPRVYMAQAGIVTALGSGAKPTIAALTSAKSALAPVSLFRPPSGEPMPVGQADPVSAAGERPRTHRLADAAAAQILNLGGPPPEAVVIGTTTGGMDMTEPLLQRGEENPDRYRLHGAGTVAAGLARRFGCTGPVLTVSTACSSGAAAVALAAAMIRSGRASRVLAGGVDALCRLTYYGFLSLQLIDPAGARPLDRDRKGMSVGEGAALMMLCADEARAGAEIAGTGLSCDAWHPTAPHPEGAGALAAMQSALEDAGLAPADIEYINLHGTGTIDNDLSEACAVRTLFGRNPPPLSSIKGATGHGLAASGAVETAVGAICLRHGLRPANTGFRHPDPALGLFPLRSPQRGDMKALLSNAFGFGGSNAAVVMTEPGRFPGRSAGPPKPFRVLDSACLTGAGTIEATMGALGKGKRCGGTADTETVAGGLDPRRIRRLRRLPRLALSLAAAACAKRRPASVHFGTGWGALSETERFLSGLFESEGRFPSPTDFVGSVHNAPAGQIAQLFGATGANLTLTGETDAFEQALLSAQLTGERDDATVLVVGADESHPRLSRLLEPSAAGNPADGGGALLLENGGGGPVISVLFFAGDGSRPEAVTDLIRELKNAGAEERFGAVLAGIPAGAPAGTRKRLEEVRFRCRLNGPVIDYRRWIGHFATASAAAAALACRWVSYGRVPEALCDGAPSDLAGRGILLVGWGASLTATEVAPG